MSRQKKEHHSLSIKIADDIYSRMCQYCEVSGQSKTKAVERGLARIMDDYDEMMLTLKKARELK